jgi:hypothetical protein
MNIPGAVVLIEPFPVRRNPLLLTLRGIVTRRRTEVVFVDAIHKPSRRTQLGCYTVDYKRAFSCSGKSSPFSVLRHRYPQTDRGHLIDALEYKSLSLFGSDPCA